MRFIFSRSHVHLSILGKNAGQGLVEYLIIVSIVAVGAIGIVKVISQNMRFHFTHVAESLGSHSPERPQRGEIRKTHFESKDFSNFWEGSK